MEDTEQYEKFRSSQQAAVKLRIALEQAFLPGLPEQHSRAYRDYLRVRIRPAMAQCVLEDDTGTLDRMEAQGWMEGIRLEDLIHSAAEQHRNAALIWLLRRKQREFGFSGPDLSL